ncbi:MAG: Gfo/Idh/MocA family oxidoreductase [Dethiobacteria bacterium]|jgi:predicted dehydrogenase|nr:Gfo/Idh/MocA family oxidoreductase [Bacillota bacterium]
MAERKKIGIGMLGAGWMGRAHTNAYITARYMFWPTSNWEPELVVIGSSTEEKGKLAAQRFGYQQGVGGYEAIINNPRVDVFDNVTPDRIHVEPSIAAAKAGKHVICEKPLAVGARDAKRMLDAVNEAKVKHLCCFNYRFFPAVQLAYDLIQDGVLGKIYHFSGNYYQDHGSDENTPAEDIWYIGWSGVAQGITSHLIDMSRFLIGEVESVHGMVRTYNKVRNSKNGPIDVTADEGFFSMVEFANGVTGVYQSLGVANGRRSRFSFEIYGSKGSLAWNVEEPNFLDIYLSESADPRVLGFTRVCATEPNHPFMNVWWPPGHTLGWEHGHINMIAHFLDCVANDKPVAPRAATFEDGYKVAVIIDTINESSKQGKKLAVQY